MPLYGGIDLPANNSVVVLLGEQDQVIYQQRLSNHLPTILEPLSRHHREIEGVVVESTYNWYWLISHFCSYRTKIVASIWPASAPAEPVILT